MVKTHMSKFYNRNIILFAFLILVLVVIVTYALIVYYDSYSRNKLTDDYFLIQNQVMMDDLYNDYLSGFDYTVDNCLALTNQINSMLNFQDDLYTRLTKVNNNGIVEIDNKLKYTYVLSNIKLWFYYNKLKTNCDMNYSVALYFYPEISGSSPEKIHSDVKTKFFENKLDVFKSDCDLKVIALPYINNVAIINQLIMDFNVNSSPAIYVNGNTYYESDIADDVFYSKLRCNR